MTIKGYHTTNGVFSASEFMNEMLKKQQKIRFSGAGASDQNGAAERAIKTLVAMARTMLMYDTLRCPEDTFSTDLWPIEMDCYIWVYNRIPDCISGFRL